MPPSAEPPKRKYPREISGTFRACRADLVRYKYKAKIIAVQLPNVIPINIRAGVVTILHPPCPLRSEFQLS